MQNIFAMLTYTWASLVVFTVLVVVLMFEFNSYSFMFTKKNTPIHRIANYGRALGNETYGRDLCSGKSVELMEERKRVLAYTMFGTNALSRYGRYVKEVANESATSHFYKNWNVWVYHEGEITDAFAAEVKKINHLVRFCNVHDVDKVLKTDLANLNGMSWRFLPVGDSTVDIACPRDLDSPLYVREEVAVGEWLASGKILHVMRDSIYHTSEIMGGLWCFRNMKNRTMGHHILNLVLGRAQHRNSAHKSESAKGDDQNVLNRHVWPILYTDSMHHDAYLCTRYKGSIPYSTQRGKVFNFIGCRRPCYGAMEDKPIKCPEICRPPAHKDWEYC